MSVRNTNIPSVRVELNRVENADSENSFIESLANFLVKKSIAITLSSRAMLNMRSLYH